MCICQYHLSLIYVSVCKCECIPGARYSSSRFNPIIWKTEVDGLLKWNHLVYSEICLQTNKIDIQSSAHFWPPVLQARACSQPPRPSLDCFFLFLQLHEQHHRHSLPERRCPEGLTPHTVPPGALLREVGSSQDFTPTDPVAGLACAPSARLAPRSPPLRARAHLSSLSDMMPSPH